MSRRPASLLLLVALLPAVAACSSGLQFEQDRRLEFTSPRADRLTTVPVTISWSMKDFSTSGPDGGQYAVFVDRAPMKVGQSLGDVVADDEAVTPDTLAMQDAYVTRKPTITLTRVNATDVRGKRQRHEVTVVLVTSEGIRERESAWTRSFDLEKVQ